MRDLEGRWERKGTGIGTEGSKASVFGTLSVVVKQPASRRVGYMLLLVVEIFTVDF